MLLRVSFAAAKSANHYTYNLGVDEPLALVVGASTTYVEQDALGSITSLTNTSGAVSDTIAYNTTGGSNHTGSTSFYLRFTGRDYDGSSNLDFNRARWYDPLTMRFVSEDPIRFSGGINFYSYSKNDPIDYVDPFGTDCKRVSEWIEMPRAYPLGGPKPYATSEDGLTWNRIAWNFLWPLRTRCGCIWVANATRIRKFFRETVTESALFQCDCGQRETRTRNRINEYEADVPGTPIMPGQRAVTFGDTFQAGANSGLNPTKNNVGCTCPPPMP